MFALNKKYLKLNVVFGSCWWGRGGSYCYLLLLHVAICGGVVGRIFVAIREELGENLCY
jgi:hypothetical protein